MKRKPLVVLDPGHGGKDSGALGPAGTRESDIVLAVCMLTGARLIGAGVDVIWTRKTDTFITLAGRAAIANRAGADAFLSVHCNAGEPGQGKGMEIFTTRGQTDGDRLATCVFRTVTAAMPNLTTRTDYSDGDPDKERDLAVVRLTRCPAALLELEFIHTVEGEAWLREKTHQRIYADAISRGILNFLGLP